MLLLWLPIVALFLGARWLMARALELRPRLLPREGALWKCALVALAGPLACVLALGLMVFGFGLVVGVPRPAPPEVVDVKPDSAGALAGLMAGDRVVALDGQPVQTVGDITSRVQAAGERPLVIEIERAGARQSLTARSQLVGESRRLGIQLDVSPRYERSLGLALQESIRFPLRLFGLLLRSFREGLLGQPVVELAAPSGIVRIPRQSPAPAQLALYIVGPWLLIAAVLGLVISLLLLLIARPHRSPPT